MWSFFKVVFFTIIMVFPFFSGNALADNNTPPEILLNDKNTQQVSLFGPSQQEMSRNSAVKVVGLDGSHGSGTYIQVGKHYIIITAAHVVDNNFVFGIVGGQGETVVGSVIYRSRVRDIAALRVPKMMSRKPVKLQPKDIKDYKIGENMVYSGYPSAYDMLTSKASISGKEKDALILQGFAWFGTSGSGIIGENGKLTAIVMGVALENGPIGPDILETLVWAHPITPVDMENIEKSLKLPGIRK